MDENESQNTSPPEGQAPAEKRKRDSVWFGLGLFLGMTALSFPLEAVLSALFGASGASGITLLFPLMLSIWLAIRSRMRTAQGVWLGYAGAAVLMALWIILLLADWAPCC